MIKLSRAEWHPIWARIKVEYPKSVWMLTYKLKDTLGFSVRHHQNPDPDTQWGFLTTICLDFYDEQMEVYFRLKYL